MTVGPTRQWPRVAPRIVTLLALAAIVLATVSARALLGEGLSERLQSFELVQQWGPSNELDILQNVLLFVPLGFGVTAWLRSAGRREPAVSLAVLGFCLSLSYVIETLQVLTPGRKAALADVAANAAGGAVGLLIARAVATRKPVAMTLVYVGILMGVSIPLQRAATFWNWDHGAYLVLGNEVSGDRGWDGHIAKILIANKPLTTPEADGLLNRAGQSGDEDAVVLRLALPKDSRCKEISSGSLRLVASGTDASERPCAEFMPDSYLQSASPASDVTNKLAQTSRLSILAEVASANGNQHGPARILTLSKNADERNVTLAQDGADLVFRLRTPITGNNGSRPELRVPDVFAGTGVKRILVSYDGASVRFEVDGVTATQPIELSPGAAVAGSVMALRQSWMPLYKLAFFVIGFGLLGCGIAAAAWSEGTGSLQFRISFLLTLLAAVSLEGLLVLVSSRPFQVANIGLSVAFLVIPITAVGIWLRMRRPFPAAVELASTAVRT